MLDNGTFDAGDLIATATLLEPVPRRCPPPMKGTNEEGMGSEGGWCATELSGDPSLLPCLSLPLLEKAALTLWVEVVGSTFV